MGIGLYQEFRQRIATVIELCQRLLSQKDGTLNAEQSECLQEIHRGILQFLETLNRHATQPYSLHDLRTPLAGVIGFAQLLAEESEGKLSSTQHQFLQQVLAHARTMLTETAQL